VTPEQQRIAVAEACPFVVKYGKGELFWRWQGRLIYFDPLNDLNAMHEAEKVVKSVWGKYVKQLNAIADPACATAAQRAEAFLRALRLWEE
jgi:hypothetical protein